MKSKRKVWIAVVILVLFAVSRWPGLLPANFSAAYALAFCAGIYFPGRLAWWLPMGVLFVTDVLLNMHYDAPLLSFYMLFPYLAYGVLIWMGRRFSNTSSLLKLLGGGILGALIFYIITNTASWLNPAPGPFPQAPYPQTLWGWIQALTIGTPPWPPTLEFFRNTLLSGGLFTGFFAGAMKLYEHFSPEEKEQEEEQEEAVPEGEPEKTEA